MPDFNKYTSQALRNDCCIDLQGRVSKKSRQFRNGSQAREAASSMKFFVNIDCLGTCDVE